MEHTKLIQAVRVTKNDQKPQRIEHLVSVLYGKNGIQKQPEIKLIGIFLDSIVNPQWHEITSDPALFSLLHVLSGEKSIFFSFFPITAPSKDRTVTFSYTITSNDQDSTVKYSSGSDFYSAMEKIGLTINENYNSSYDKEQERAVIAVNELVAKYFSKKHGIKPMTTPALVLFPLEHSLKGNKTSPILVQFRDVPTNEVFNDLRLLISDIADSLEGEDHIGDIRNAIKKYKRRVNMKIVIHSTKKVVFFFRDIAALLDLFAKIGLTPPV